MNDILPTSEGFTATATPPKHGPETLADGTRVLFVEENDTTKYMPYVHPQTNSLCLAILDKRTGHALSVNIANLGFILGRLGEMKIKP